MKRHSTGAARLRTADHSSIRTALRPGAAFGLCILVYLAITVAGCSSDAQPSSQTERIEKTLTAIEKRLAAIEERLTITDAAPSSPATLHPSPTTPDSADQRLTALGDRVAAMSDRLTALADRLTAIEARPASPVTHYPSPTPTVTEPRAQASGSPAQTPALPVTRHPSLTTLPASGPAVITVSEPSHDFGTTWVATSLKHSFSVANTGSAPLEITRVSPSCGCTVAGDYPRKIEPGQSGQFPFTLDAKGLRGVYSKTIRVLSNDPARPELTLTLRGENKFYVDVSPPVAGLGTPYGDEVRKQVLKITNNTKEPLKLTLSKPTQFAAELIEKTPGQAFELHIATKPPYQPGQLTETLTLQTNVEAQKTVDVRLYARVPERLDAYPSPVVPYKKSGTDQLTSRVEFTNYGPTPAKVLKATTNDPNLTAEVAEDTPGKKYTVNLQSTPGYQVPSEGRLLTLTTDDPQKPTITVPIQSSYHAPGTAVGSAMRTDPTSTRPASAPASPLIGQAAPAFSLKTIDGKPVGDGQFAQASATVLNFIAPTCGFCKKQIPVVEKVRADFAPKGIRFVNMGQTMGKKPYTDQELASAIKALGSNLELAPDPGNAVGRSYQATGFPTMVIVGRDGRIAHVNRGARPDLDQLLRSQLSALLGEPAAAAVSAGQPAATPGG